MTILNIIKSWVSSKNLPTKTFSRLNVRTNSVIIINDALLVLHDHQTIMDNPGPDHQVVDISYLTLAGEEMYRFYTESILDGTESFLQIFNNPFNTEVVLFRTVDEIWPSVPCQWDEWNGPGTGMIFGDVFHIDEDVEFQKVWDAPYLSSETVVPNETTGGEDEYTYPLVTQLFSRTIADGVIEYAIISIENQEKINVYVGLNVDITEVL